MAKKSIVQIKIDAEDLTQTQRILFADLIIQEIKKRTDQGIDKDGNSFPSYSKSYRDSDSFKIAGKSSSVDLILTGELMGSLEMIEESDGYVVVGYDPSTQVADVAEGNIIGSYGKPSGNPSKARNFLGLPEKVLNRLREQARGEKLIEIEEDDVSKSYYERFLESITRQSNGD